MKYEKITEYTIADIQSVQSSIFDVNSDAHFLQPPDLTDSFQRIPTKTAERLYQDHIDFFAGAVSHELLVARTVGSTDTGCNIRIYRNKFPV